MAYRKVKWKRNLNKATPKLTDKVKEISPKLLRVALSKQVPVADLQNGVYRHIGLKMKDSAITVGPPVVPPANSGKWSERNIHGWENVRRDLPMIEKTRSWETPNFGDPSRGYHTHWQTRMVYQREIFMPQYYEIATELLSDASEISSNVLVKFEVLRDLDPRDANFERELLWCLNLLQENVGAVDVFPSDATRADFLKTQQLAWQVFPPGTALETIVKAFRKPSEPHFVPPRGPLEDRIRLFASLGADAVILRCVGSFESYIGAKYFDDLVVFENVRYGNALYVLYDNWEEVSKRPRSDILRGTDENYDRFVHTDGWEKRFKNHIKEEIKKRSGKSKRKR